MWALFLVAFYSFLRKSNLVVDAINVVSPKVLLCSNLSTSAVGFQLQVSHTKTIQFRQRILSIPLPEIAGSSLCPVAALRQHFAINRLSISSQTPLFSVWCNSLRKHKPITYAQFSSFLKSCVLYLGLDPATFSPHSFRRGGASFAFACGVPSELIQLQGDWKSDAYLVYLHMSDAQKYQAVRAMAHEIARNFSI